MEIEKKHKTFNRFLIILNASGMRVEYLGETDKSLLNLPGIEVKVEAIP